MHNCFIYMNCSQSLLPTPWFGVHKCWKFLDCLIRPTVTLYHLITKQYSFQLHPLHFLLQTSSAHFSYVWNRAVIRDFSTKAWARDSGREYWRYAWECSWRGSKRWYRILVILWPRDWGAVTRRRALISRRGGVGSPSRIERWWLRPHIWYDVVAKWLYLLQMQHCTEWRQICVNTMVLDHARSIRPHRYNMCQLAKT